MDYSNGSIWRRWDFHFHTPSSFDYHNFAVTNQQLVDGLRKEHVSVVVVTDHFKLDANRIKSMQDLAEDDLVVLPGIELRTNQGAKECLHIVGIFPETLDYDDLWHHLSGKLDLTDSDIKDCGGPESKYVDFLTAIEGIHDLGGLVSVHAGSKSNGIEGIPNKPRFREFFKEEMLRKHVDILDVGKPVDKADYDDIVFPDVHRTLPIVLGSDCHDIGKYHDCAKPCWIKADATFEGLRQVLRMPEDRVCLETEPGLIVARRQHPTEFVERVTIKRCSDTNPDEKWFDGASVPLNPGMTAIIGNKGSGKSALAEIIGLLGNWSNTDDFTFLTADRFRKARKAEAFVGSAIWGDSECRERNLMADPSANEQARIRFISQSFLETVCNELVDVRGSKFQNEIERVVYSHVSEPDRLGCNSLDEIIVSRTTVIKERTSSLRSELHKVNEDIVELELRRTDDNRQALRNRVLEGVRVLKSHCQTRPTPIPDPDKSESAAPEEHRKIREQIDDIKKRAKTLGDQIESERLRQLEVAKLADTCSQLKGALHDFSRRYDEFVDNHREDAKSLGLDLADLLKLSVDIKPIDSKSEEFVAEAAHLCNDLDEESENSLPGQKNALQQRIAELQEQLDEPRKAYQAYLELESHWQGRRKEIIGGPGITGTLRASVDECLEWKLLPARIIELRTKRAEKVVQIHRAIDEIRGIYEDLYRPVQEFASNHELLKNVAPVTFSAAVTQVEFASLFGDMINHGRKGVFYGGGEAAQYVRDLLRDVDFSTFDNTLRFIDDRVLELTTKERRTPVDTDEDMDMAAAATIGEQLRQGYDVVRLYDFLYGIEYLEARYDLRFDGRTLGELSPGEKGSVLLIFYLLLDRSTYPLVIDQPESNLDNETVVTTLVPCVSEARKHRQIVLVTHNPNLAVVCDADEIIRASMVKDRSFKITYSTGAIESPAMNKHIVDVLEGTQSAFQNW